MNKIPNIALYEENDSELAKYTIMQLQGKIDKAIEEINKSIPYVSEPRVLEYFIEILKGE